MGTVLQWADHLCLQDILSQYHLHILSTAPMLPLKVLELKPSCSQLWIVRASEMTF